MGLTDCEVWRTPGSPLGVSVRYICGHSSQEQMLWIHARRRIAPMANAHSVWNTAVLVSPHQSVDTPSFPIDHRSAVSILILQSDPEMASV
jgi:hypothetical protein